MPGKKLVSLIALLVLVTVATVLICFLLPQRSTTPSFTDSDAFHIWLHEQLNVTADQEKAILTIEDEYQRHKAEHVARMRDLNRELAVVILEDEGDSSRVQGILSEIHRTQGELQQLTISHIFEMKEFLEPSQYRLLLEHTAQALADDEEADSQ